MRWPRGRSTYGRPAGAAALRDQFYKDPIGFERAMIERYHTNPMSIPDG